ncbi:hypothetical protein FOZ61_005721 [Perkinsus olseni]|uniref:Uncharacterized protein n=1 Tax=Perkinsus olseni TaxID=32597 RepID=A0A7J6LG95_PEROL|nr:hypothetical protein FOZ61_005721 [Perkinsus olseni]
MFDDDNLLKAFNEVAHALADERGLLGRIRAEHDELKDFWSFDVAERQLLNYNVAESVIADLARLRAAARATEVPPVAQKKEEDTTSQQQQQSEDNVESPPKKDVIDDPVERILSRAKEALLAEKLERKIDRPSYKRETARRVGKIEEARDGKARGKENTKSNDLYFEFVYFAIGGGAPSSTARKPPERPGVAGTAGPGDLKKEARNEGVDITRLTLWSEILCCMWSVRHARRLSVWLPTGEEILGDEPSGMGRGDSLQLTATNGG